MKFKFLVLAITLIMAPAAQAADNPDLSAFKEFRRMLRHSHLKEPRQTFTGDIKPVLEKMQADYRKLGYGKSVDIWGSAGYWATREETKRKGGGDCKAIAVSEYFDLLEMGVADDRMHIDVVQIPNGEIHAVLQVDQYILDSRIVQLYTVDLMEKMYHRFYSINRKGWHHDSPAKEE